MSELKELTRYVKKILKDNKIKYGDDIEDLKYAIETGKLWYKILKKERRPRKPNIAQFISASFRQNFKTNDDYIFLLICDLVEDYFEKLEK